MNSVIITKKGSFECGLIPKPVPEADQLLVKVDSAMINPTDLMFMYGMYSVRHPYPFTPGREGSGTVEAVGKDLD